eukprot:3984174-Pyramimonas_sp.AAC.1
MRRRGTADPKVLALGPRDPETRRPGDPETRRPGDPETWRPEDLETRRPGDPETRRPGDLETRRPGDQETHARLPEASTCSNYTVRVDATSAAKQRCAG